MSRVAARLRRYLVLGLIVIAPVGVTVFILRWLFERIDVIIGRYLPPIVGVRWPGLGILALVVLLLIVGWISDRTFGRRVLDRWNNLLARVPLVRRVHGASSRIVQAVLDRDENLFRYCALIEYPDRGSWALVFATARAPRETEEEIGATAVSVFLPTVPNPTSGYLLILPEERVHRLEMSVEDGFRMILSVGAAVPPEEDTEEIRLAGEPGSAAPSAGRRADLSDLEAAADAEPGRDGPGEGEEDAGPDVEGGGST